MIPSAVNHAIRLKVPAWVADPQELETPSILAYRFHGDFQGSTVPEFAYFLPILRTNSRQSRTKNGIQKHLANRWKKEGWAQIGKYKQGGARRGKSHLSRLLTEGL